MDFEKYQELKEAESDYQRKADEARGVRTSKIKELKSKFGLATLEEAKKELAKRSKQIDKLEAELAPMMEKFEERYEQD